MAKKGKGTDEDYQVWRKSLPINLQYEGDYDLRGYYNKYGAIDINHNSTQHLTDEFKLPNHKTFSNESVYYNYATMPEGGYWKGDIYRPNDPLIKDIVDEAPIKAYGGDLMKYAKVKKIKRLDYGGGINYDQYLNHNGTNDSGRVGDTNPSGNLGKYAGYAALGSSAISGYNTIQNSNLTQKGKADATYDMGATLGKSVNPIVGAAWSLGDAIGDPIKRNSERLNEDGTLVNRTGARNAAVVGSLFNPLKALTTRMGYKGGFSDFSGNGYADSLEVDSKAAYAQKQKEEADALATENKRKLDEQMMYTQGYNAANPIYGREGAGIYGNGGDFDPITGQHKLQKGETPYTSKDLAKLGYELGPTEGEYVSPQGVYVFYKPIPYTEGNTNTTDMNNKAKPYLSWPARTDYSAGSKGPRYSGEMAYGGKMAIPYSRKAIGGELNPLASDMTKAEGATHEEGGVTLQNQGQPIAEVEDQEVMKGSKVFSDRLEITPGVTFAKKAEQLGKKKGKFEEWAESNNYREKNTGERKTAHIDTDLANLYQTQEMKKIQMGIEDQPVNVPRKANGGAFIPNKGSLTYDEIKDEELYANGTNSPGRYSRIDWNKMAQNATPYIDNVYNTSLIANTPDIPVPAKRVSYDLKPVTLKTNVNVSPQLNDTERSYQLLNKDFNENTSNSVTARGNKLAAFVSLLNNKSGIYGNKENMETDLINKSNMNVQNTINQNTQNRQNIDNQNIDATNTYNWAKMQRSSDINAMKGKNVANAVNDMTTQVQDQNMATLDEKRIMTDALRYNDGAGFARSVGTPTMDSLVRSNPQYYIQIEKALKDSNQVDALNAFYQRYGKNG